MAVISQGSSNRRGILLDRLKTRLQVDGLPDSPVAILAEVIGSEIEIIENEIYDYFYRSNITNASGEDLEATASSDYNTSRLIPTVGSSDQFYFFTTGGLTFGDLNDGEDITIPEGTLLGLSTPVENSNVIYEIKEQVLLRADLSETPFYAESRSTGSDQNVAESTIRFHNFNNYTRSAEDLLKITNSRAITNASDQETDESLRLRCVGQNQRQVERNKNYIFLSLLEESSVYDFEIIESYYGIGTVGVIVKGNGGGEVSDAVLSRLDDLIATEAKHLGQQIIFSKGLKVKLEIDIDCESTNSNLTSEEKQDLESTLISAVFENIKSQEFNKIINFISLENDLKTIYGIKKVGTNNSILTQIIRSVEDENDSLGEPEDTIIDRSLPLIINRDEYIGTDLIINVTVR